jgi:trimeric autotransporter adhesin
MNTRYAVRAASLAALTIVLTLSPYARAAAASTFQINDPVTDTVQLWSAVANVISSFAQELSTTVEQHFSAAYKAPNASRAPQILKSPVVAAAIAATTRAAPLQTVTSSRSAPGAVVATKRLPSRSPPIPLASASSKTPPNVVSPASAFVTQNQFNAAISALGNSVRQLIAESSSNPVVSGYGAPLSAEAFAPSQQIGQLYGVTITNANLSASEIPTDIVASNYLPLSGGTLTGTLSVPIINASSTILSGFSTTNATSTNFFALNASTTNATSTTLFSSLANLGAVIANTFDTSVANIVGLTATNSTTTNATTTNSYATSAVIQSLGINGQTFTNLLGTGLNNTAGTLAVSLSPFTTSDLAEGSNLYFTGSRVASILAGTTTDALAEGTTNKYFTNTRAQNAISVSGGPLTYSTGIIGINQASGSQAGYLTSSDWTTFNGKLGSSTISTLTPKSIPKWTGSMFTNSLLTDTGTNIGIGTTSPTALLTLDSSSPNGTILRVSNSSPGAHIYDWLSTGSGNTGGAGRLDLYDFTAGAARFSIAANGHFGVGTTSPSTTFAVAGSQYMTGGLGVGIVNVAPGTLETSGNATIGGSLSAGVTSSLGGNDSSQSPVVNANQGYAFDGTYNYLFSTNEIDKRNNDGTWSLVTSNSNPLGGISGVNHLGDGDVYNGLLYSPIETFSGCGLESGMKILVSNASDLSQNSVVDISAQNFGLAALAIAPDIGADGTIFIGSFCDGTKLAEYDLSNFSFLGYLTLSNPISDLQGLAYKNGVLYADGSPDNDHGILYEIASSTGIVQSIYSTPVAGEPEGIDFHGTYIGWLINPGSNDVVHFISFQTSALSAFTVTSAGNVGIGTTTPYSRLAITGPDTSGSTLALLINNSANNGLFSVSDGGQIGIGTTSPQKSQVQIVSNALGQFGAVLRMTTTAGTTNGDFFLASTDNSWSIGGNKLIFGAGAPSSGNVKMTMNNSGFLGIGTTSPASPLDIFGNSTGGSYQLGLTGSGNYTQIRYNGARNWQTGVGNAGETSLGVAGKYYVYDAGAAAVRMTIDGSGNVGIGTTSPSAMLHISGSSISGAGQPNVELSNTGAGGADWSMIVTNSSNGSGGGRFIILPSSGSSLNAPFSINGTFVGIGTTTPWGRFSVTGSGTGSTYTFVAANSNNAPLFNIQDNGNVGIGTTNPQSILSLGNALQTNKLLIYDNNNTNKYGFGVANGSLQVYAGGGSNSNRIAFGKYDGTTFTENVSLINSGNVGIGTTTPYSRLEVWGPDSAASTTAFLVANNASTTEFAVLDNGNATLAGGLIQNSDQRLKTNIDSLDASSSLSLIDRLNPVTFNWIDPNKGATPQLGFVAQQVLPIFPNLVATTSPTALTPDGTLAVNYIDLISPIVSAIQALSVDITSIENTIAGFAEAFVSNRITAAQELCVGSTCVTPAQFQAMVAAANGSQAGGSSSSSSGNDAASTAPEIPPVISINGDNPAFVQVGATYSDLGATITGPQADLNLGINTFLNGTLTSSIVIDTSTAATDTIDYVTTDQNGLTSTSTRTIIIEAASSLPPVQ